MVPVSGGPGLTGIGGETEETMTTEARGSLFDALRKNETQAAWLAYLEGLGDPTFPVELPDDAEMADILRDFEVPEEDIPAVLASRPDPNRDPERWWLLERSVVELVSTMGSLDNPPWFPSPCTVAGLHPFFFVHVFIATLPHTRRYHRAHGIPDDIARATLADLGRNVRVNHKRYGEGGLEVSHWLMLHFRGRIYQLGRLQFERARLWERAVKSARAHGYDASSDDLALSVHIPDFLGPMTPEVCDESFAMARGFFPAHFPDEHIGWGCARRGCSIRTSRITCRQPPTSFSSRTGSSSRRMTPTPTRWCSSSCSVQLRTTWTCCRSAPRSSARSSRT